MQTAALVAGLLFSFVVGTNAVPATAADLPPHGPLRILVVSDAVNPHGLSSADLTEPGDLSAAFLDPASGLTLDPAPDGVVEIATDDLDQATALLAVPITDPAAYDVLVYFSHREPSGGGGAALQAAFVAEVEDFLEAGGGVVSFHHGAYLGPGKASMLDLIGATAQGAVPWNTVDGQNVINVAPSHFVSSHGVEYPSSTTYADVARGVSSGTYPVFNNTPDERYIDFEINPGAGTIRLLFASDYVQNGATHVLGFVHTRPAWAGRVVVYQPGEYQPNALDDEDGNNFQILANAVVYAAGQEPVAMPASGLMGRAILVAMLVAAAWRQRFICFGGRTTMSARFTWMGWVTA